MIYCIAGICLEVKIDQQLEKCWRLFVMPEISCEPDIICSLLDYHMINRDIMFSRLNGVERIFMSGSSFVLSDKSYHNSYVLLTDETKLPIFWHICSAHVH